MSTPTFEKPPSFQGIHSVDLTSTHNSKIISVSVYSGRAEITRLFKFDVKTGQNQVNIRGLPNVLDQDSLRVEGRGAATIHDVTVSTMPRSPRSTTTPILNALLIEKNRILKALTRCRKSLASLETYLATLNVQYVDGSNLGNVIRDCDVVWEKLDDRVSVLEEELCYVEKEEEAERAKITGGTIDQQLSLQALIGIFAVSEGEAEIALIYAVSSATWTAGYDVRVDMHAKQSPVTLVYKAAITQNTGEAWDDVPLTLETATPTFGVDVPVLSPWNIAVYKPQPVAQAMTSSSFSSSAPAHGTSMRAKKSMSRRSLLAEWKTESDVNSMAHRGLAVSSKGNINATFQIPGTIDIPSDDVAHNVTIVQLKLDAAMSWVCVPKMDTKTRLSAKIKNASEYTLLHGSASVYVDGSFISRSEVPPVSPGESFDCPLGLDSSIRVTYHPCIKRVTQSGFYTKVSNHVFSQPITIFNTKSTAIDKVKIVDQIPVSGDSQIAVKLVSPPLTDLETKDNGTIVVPPPIEIRPGVMAQWNGADEQEFSAETVGRNGKFDWVCSLPSQGKVDLLLQWEMSAPAHAIVTGL